MRKPFARCSGTTLSTKQYGQSAVLPSSHHSRIMLLAKMRLQLKQPLVWLSHTAARLSAERQCSCNGLNSPRSLIPASPLARWGLPSMRESGRDSASHNQSRRSWPASAAASCCAPISRAGSCPPPTPLPAHLGRERTSCAGHARPRRDNARRSFVPQQHFEQHRRHLSHGCVHLRRVVLAELPGHLRAHVEGQRCLAQRCCGEPALSALGPCLGPQLLSHDTGPPYLAPSAIAQRCQCMFERCSCALSLRLPHRSLPCWWPRRQGSLLPAYDPASFQADVRAVPQLPDRPKI